MGTNGRKKNVVARYRIGVRQPFSDRDAVIDTVAVKDLSVVSSGIYERCFKQNGKFYIELKQTIGNKSGDFLDFKAYEPDMRKLIDNYIVASDSI